MATEMQQGRECCGPTSKSRFSQWNLGSIFSHPPTYFTYFSAHSFSSAHSRALIPSVSPHPYPQIPQFSCIHNPFYLQVTQLRATSTISVLFTSCNLLMTLLLSCLPMHSATQGSDSLKKPINVGCNH